MFVPAPTLKVSMPPSCRPMIFSSRSFPSYIRQQWLLKGSVSSKPAPPDSHTNCCQIIICCRRCLQIFFWGYTAFTLGQYLWRAARQTGQRSNREDTRNCDSKQRATPLIRASLWLHTALFTLVSLTDSCPIVTTKHGESRGPSSPTPLWPTVGLTSRSRAWFLPRLVCQRISAEQKPKQTFPIKKSIHENVGGREKKQNSISILCNITVHE